MPAVDGARCGQAGYRTPLRLVALVDREPRLGPSERSAFDDGGARKLPEHAFAGLCGALSGMADEIQRRFFGMSSFTQARGDGVTIHLVKGERNRAGRMQRAVFLRRSHVYDQRLPALFDAAVEVFCTNLCR